MVGHMPKTRMEIINGTTCPKSAVWDWISGRGLNSRITNTTVKMTNMFQILLKRPVIEKINHYLIFISSMSNRNFHTSYWSMLCHAQKQRFDLMSSMHAAMLYVVVLNDR